MSECPNSIFSHCSAFETAFNALTLLVGYQEEHMACKNVMRCCCGYLSGARCRLFAYGPADALLPKTHHLLLHLNLRLILLFWYQLAQVVMEKRPLNGCSISSVLLPNSAEGAYNKAF